MPQDSFRSVVYRSFVTCDDPKGVVEYGTSKKSKTRTSKSEDKDKSQMTKTKETDSMEDLYNSPSSLQLLEVSREAKKLNQTIDSWSNGVSFDGQLAKSLLRGAIDLQESLVMLGKLQEASRYMSKSKKKGREKVDEARSESTNRTNSDRFGDEIYRKEFQDLKRSGDGSSSDSINELRRAIRESFAKQNLLPDSRKEEETFYDARGLDYPSTSSSQSSEMYSKDRSRRLIVDDNGVGRTGSSRFDDQNYPMSCKKPQVFAKGSSNDSFEELRRAIRHGLAEQNLLPNPIKERKIYHDRGRFDSGSEVPSTSSSHFSMVNSNNLGSSSTASSSSSTALEKAKAPNLIAKLMGLEEFPTSDMSNPQGPMFDIEMPKTRNHYFVAQKADPEHRGTLREVLETMHFKGLMKSKPVNVHKKAIDDMAHIVIMKPSHFSPLESEKVRSTDTHATSRVSRKLIVKEEERPRTGTGRKKTFFNTKEKCMNPESVQEKPIKEIGQTTKSAGSKVARGSEDGTVKSKQEISYKSKPLVPVAIKSQKHEVSDKKAQTVPKATKIAKKEPNAKSKSPSKSGNDNVTLAKTSKHETTTRTKQIKNHSSSYTKTRQAKKTQPDTEGTASNFVAEENDSRMNLSCDNELGKIIRNMTLANHLQADEEQETSTIEYEECFHDDVSFLGEAVVPSNHRENLTLCSEEAKDHKDKNEAESKSISNAGTLLKDMLFNSPSFIANTNNLLGFSMDHHSTMSQSSSVNGVEEEEPDSRLFLDCANELLERKIRQVSQPHSWCLQKHFSLDQLANEVYEGVEILRCYADLCSENFHKDGVLLMLDHDMKCKENVSSVWECPGWKTGFSRIEVDQVGFDIEKIVLEGLIDEVFINLV